MLLFFKMLTSQNQKTDKITNPYDCILCNNQPRGGKNFERWYREAMESFPKSFMVTVEYSYNGKLNVKIT